MNDEQPSCPFERAIVGQHGAYLARHNPKHSKLCAKAIRRRDQPAWSRFSESVSQ
jgi:hypothetical protein